MPPTRFPLLASGLLLIVLMAAIGFLAAGGPAAAQQSTRGPNEMTMTAVEMQNQTLETEFAMTLTAIATNPPPRTDDLRVQIADAEAGWGALGITDYVIRIEYYSAWTAVAAQVTVRDGQPVELRAECGPGAMPGPCSLTWLDARDYTVEGLFQMAQDAAGYSEGRWTGIGFDHAYRFPASISYNDPEVMDGFWSIRVTYFGAIGDPNTPPPPDWQWPAATQIALDQTATVEASAPSAVTPTPAPGPVQPPFDENLIAWIDNAEAEWNALGIDTYTLVVRRSGAWAGMQITLDVREGRVITVAATCEPGAAVGLGGPCWLDPFVASDFAVPGLFQQARRVAGMPMPLFNPLEFDPVYHFPVSIFFDDLAMADEQWGLDIVRFAPRSE